MNSKNDADKEREGELVDHDLSNQECVVQAKQAWNAVGEKTRRSVCVALRDTNPRLFDQLCGAAKIREGYRPETIARRKSSTVRRALDKALWKDGGRLAGSMLVAYFKDCQVEINEKFLKETRLRGLTEDDSDGLTVQSILENLKQEHDGDLVSLYAAVLKWHFGGWFIGSHKMTPMEESRPPTTGEYESEAFQPTDGAGKEDTSPDASSHSQDETETRPHESSALTASELGAQDGEEPPLGTGTQATPAAGLSIEDWGRLRQQAERLLASLRSYRSLPQMPDEHSSFRRLEEWNSEVQEAVVSLVATSQDLKIAGQHLAQLGDGHCPPECSLGERCEELAATVRDEEPSLGQAEKQAQKLADVATELATKYETFDVREAEVAIIARDFRESPWKLPAGLRANPGCRLIAETDIELTKMSADLRTRYCEAVEQAQKTVASEVEKLLAEATLEETLRRRAKDLGLRAGTSDSLAELLRIIEEISSLATSARGPASGGDSRELAASIVSERGRWELLPALCEALLREEKAPVALVALALAKRHVPLRVLGLSDYSDLIRLWMVASLHTCRMLPDAVSEVELTAALPWGLAIDKDLICGRSIRMLLSVFLLVGATSNRNRFSPLCFSLGAYECFPADRYPALSVISEALKTDRGWRPVDIAPKQTVESAQEAVKEAFSSLFVKVVEKAKVQWDPLMKGVTPELKALWREIRKTAEESADKAMSLLEKFDDDRVGVLVGRHCRFDSNRTYFEGLIRDEIQELKSTWEQYVAAKKALQSETSYAVSKEKLRSELRQLARDNIEEKDLWDHAEVLLLESVPQEASRNESEWLWAVARDSDEIVRLIPEVLLNHFRNSTAEWSMESLHLLLERVSGTEDTDVGPQQLEGDKAWPLLLSLAPLGLPSLPCAEEIRRSHDDCLQSLKTRLEKLERYDPEHAELLLPLLESGHWGEIRRELDQAESTARQKAEAEVSELDGRLRRLKREIRSLQDKADESDSDEDWVRDTRHRTNALVELIGRGLSPQRTRTRKQEVLDASEGVLEVLERHVRHADHDFSALDLALEQCEGHGADDAASDATETASADFDPAKARKVLLRRHFSSSDPDAIEVHVRERTELWELFVRMSRLDDDARVGDHSAEVRQTLKKVASLLKMYHDEKDDEQRFILVKRPGARFACAETSFYKPGSPHFDFSIRLYPITGERPARHTVDRLKLEINSDSASGINHILLVPGNADGITRALSSGPASACSTVVDRRLFKRILEAPQPWAPLRQQMRRNARLHVTSPFVFEGPVCSRERIFVGRSHLLGQLTDRQCRTLWGGRRSGKSSLLHEAGLRVSRQLKKRYATAYITLEALYGQPASDMDAAVVKKISGELGWESRPASIPDFEAHLVEHCAENPTYLFVDEVDAYVGPFLDANDTSFGVIRALRGVRNKVGDNFVCVFAGFKLLYSATTHAASDRDSSYPWKSWLSRTEPLTRLSPEETRDLVTEGFVDILGLEMHPSVPNKIFDYTAGHPVFVQNFCYLVLENLSELGRRQTPRVTGEIVERTFNGATGLATSMSFFNFVESQLDMNLSELERVVIYVMAAQMIGENGDPRKDFSIGDTSEAVNEWFRGLGRRERSESEMGEALEYLVMTDMLERVNANYKMAFPTYSEILLRLELADRGKIEKLVMRVKD